MDVKLWEFYFLRKLFFANMIWESVGDETALSIDLGSQFANVRHANVQLDARDKLLPFPFVQFSEQPYIHE